MSSRVVQFQPATDIYALGATFYKLLTGITPLEATQLASGEELPPLPDGTSKQVAKAIRSAMQLNRANRPQNVATFLALLDSVPDSVQGDEVTVLDAEPRTSYQPTNRPTQTSLVSTPQRPTPSEASNHNELPKPTPRRSFPWVAVVLGLVVVAILCIRIIPRDTPAQKSQPTTGTINGHEWVDLGLSVKWATCNVGANAPSDYGNYYAWGETRTKSEYTSDNSVTYGKTIGDIAGDPTYDAATANWGSSWRLPTKDEIDELINKCKREWTTLDGHKGYTVTGPNGNSIFLPVVGERSGTLLFSTPWLGSYWSATPYEDDTDCACCLLFASGDFRRLQSDRGNGRSVRPVSE